MAHRKTLRHFHEDAESRSPTGWTGAAPVIGVNQAFFVLPSQPCTLTIPGITGSPTDYTYSLAGATVTAGGTTASFGRQRLLTISAWDVTTQSYIVLSGSSDITSWTGYAFDAREPLTVTFGDGSPADYTTTTYDRLGRTLTTTDPRGVTHTYTYGDNGTKEAGQVTLDDAAVPSGVDATVQSIATDYDDMGRVQTVTSYSGTNGSGAPLNEVFDAYDGWGNLAEEWQNPDGGFTLASGQPTAAPAVEYTYADGASGDVAAYLRLEQVTYPSGQEIDYNYGVGSTLPQAAVDAIMSRLSSISDGNSGATDAVYTYLGLDTIVTEDYNDPSNPGATPGVALDYLQTNYSGFDRFGRVQTQLWGEDDSPGTAVDETAYSRLDPEGDVTGEVESANGTTLVTNGYAYDALNRVTQWTQGSAQKTYAYDSLGNNSDPTTGGTYNLVDNEEVPNTGTACYDAAGNMITLSSGDTAVYDAWGRLVEVDNGSGIVEQFRYDGTGRRVQVLSNFSGGSPSTAENAYYSGQQVVETDWLSGGTYANGIYTGGTMTGGYQYVWSPRYVDAPILRDTLDASGNLIQADRIFYLTDADNNVTAVMDYNTGTGTWQVAARYSYDPYGNATEFYSNGDTIDNNILYAGYTYDAATGLYFDRARYYDPALNRFISRDPLGYAGSPINLYEYCDDDPLDATDPSGLNTIHWPWGEPTPTPPQPLPVTPTPGLPEPNWGLLAPGFGPGVATFSINAPLNSELFTTFGLLPKPPHLIIIQPSPLPGSPGSDTDPFGNPRYPWEAPGHEEKPPGESGFPRAPD